MITLGVSDTHNAAAALITTSGELLALQEERTRRIKNYSGFPEQSIRWLLSRAEVADPRAVQCVAVAGYHKPPDRDRDALIAEYRNIDSPMTQLKRVLRHTPVFTLAKRASSRRRLASLLSLGFRGEAIRFFEHHACHAAAAYYGWGRGDEPILVLTCDGAGDALCATVSIGEQGRLRRLYEVPWAESIGDLYAVVTYMTGMVPLEHEYKIMGMAPYARGRQAERVADRLWSLFEWPQDGTPVWGRRPGVPHTYYIKRRLARLFLEERFDAVMAGTQRFLERMLCEFVRRAVRKTGIRKVAMSGGVFMNVKANKEIMNLAEIEDLFVFPSCGDETNALGAAYLARAEQPGHGRMAPLGPFYLGPEWPDVRIREAIDEARGRMDLVVHAPADLNQQAAQLLAQGEIVARFSGREEFGARSLGNRAILADPRRPELVQAINEMVKNRDFWMPFAASILEDYADRYLVNPKRIPAPYMILSFDTTEDGRRSLKAGTHPYDGTCRAQVVLRSHNVEYWDLIDKFARLTGVGGILNTSLNLHGLPLVHRPQDAFEVLDKSGLRYLVMGRYLGEKRG